MSLLSLSALVAEVAITSGSDFKFAFPIDRGEIPRGTFHAILDQTGGLSEEQLCQALNGAFIERSGVALSRQMSPQRDDATEFSTQDFQKIKSRTPTHYPWKTFWFLSTYPKNG
jgi:hypothetical protein